MRLWFLIVLSGISLGGCISQSQATNAISPPPSGGGTLTCRQIVETCDSQCGDPLCVRRCGDEGTPEAAQQHTAVFDCAQRNGCTDEACIRASCGPEFETCQGPEPIAPDPAPPAPAPGEPAPPAG